MRNGLFLLVGLGLVAGCADADTTSGTGGGSSTSTTSTSSTGGSGTGGSSTTTTSSTGGGTTTGTGGGGPDSCLDDTVQLLISEIATQPGAGEYIEVYNPSAQAVDVTDYYLSDNSIYYAMANGTAWAPQGTPNTDFLVQFPAGTSIPSGEVVTIESSDVADGFFTTYGVCPDFSLKAGVTCNGSAVPQMKIPATVGGVAATSNLSNDGEMVILFCYGGGNVVHDVDYVTWDDDLTDANTHVDKTGKPGYSADTATASQSLAGKPAVGETIARCNTTETGEAMTGGNGLLGHDETSETLATSFTIQTAPTPGSPTCN
jgi:hypothetical protein